MALFNGELDFSSTIDAMDSTEDTREWDPKGRFGMRVELGSKKGSGACLLIASDRKRIAVKVYIQVKFLIHSLAMRAH